MTQDSGYRPYAGVGSRETPRDILQAMAHIAIALYGHGFTLRSGGAPGADTAFEKGVHRALLQREVNGEDWGDPKEIYIPWEGFQRKQSNLSTHGDPYVIRVTDTKAAYDLAAKHHPAWSHLSSWARRLHARNCYQILGRNLDSPVEFVVCWTKDGAENAAQTSKDTGGTGMAIRLADAYGIAVYNLANETSRVSLSNFLEEL